MVNSTVALLGTLRELHTKLTGYDWDRLRKLVATKNPDLLCVEMDRPSWESNNLDQAPIEGREVLVQLSRTSEITLVPIGAGGRLWAESGIASPSRGVFASLRRRLSRLLDNLTVGLMRIAGGPRAINSPVVEHLCGVFCSLQVLLTDREARRAWTAKNQELLDGILWAVANDPGRRVLVVLDCRRKHWLYRRLRSAPEVNLVDFWRF